MFERIKELRVMLFGSSKVTPVKVEHVTLSPDLSTKPESKVGYCFAFVCAENHHVNEKFESLKIESLNERRVCQFCGNLSEVATVKRIAEPKWTNVYSDNWDWTFTDSFTDKGYFLDIRWTRHEFLKFVGDSHAG